MQRRDFIRLVGGGAVLAAGATGCAPIPDARAAWKSPGAGEHDARRRALSYAILAPNPHNMQPWLADISAPGRITLFVDPTRLLPQTDPFGRQIVIGCGAFLELLRMAAAAEGYLVTVTPFPDGAPAPQLDARPIAHVDFTASGARPDPLFAHALARRTSRIPFTAEAVPEDAARAIAAETLPGVAAGYTVDAARLPALKAIARESSRLEANTPAVHRETCERTFIGARDVAAHRYGIALEGPAIEAAHAVGLLTQKAMADPKSWAFKQTVGFMDPMAESAAGFIWLITDGDSREGQLAVGGAYLRQNLAATARSLAMHPFSQPLQEYDSMRPLYGRIHRLLSPEGGRVQMFARIGHVKAAPPPAPRRGLADNLRPAAKV